MKNIDFLQNNFRELTTEESYTCNGGGFAYDAGRFLRFALISQGGVHHAITDAVYNMVK